MSVPNISETGAHLIAAERQRQIDVEGYQPEHDDHHASGELLNAAHSYLVAPFYRDHAAPPWSWPWPDQYWKPIPDHRVRELVKAGALIAAEIDRLQRSTARTCG